MIGIIATIVVSKYYYKQSLKTALTPFIQFSSIPLRGIDINVRKALEIKYNNECIQNLFEIQFLIANTGNKVIKGVIEPLSLQIPDNCKLLDANILYIDPEGRNVELNLSSDKTSIEYKFNLLNSGEFFITRLLINGKPSEKDFIFKIAAEELSPILETKPLPYDAIESGVKKVFDIGDLITGMIFILLSGAIFKLIADSWLKMPSFRSLPLLKYIQNLGLSGFSVYISFIPAVIFLILGIMLGFSAFPNFRIPFLKVKRKFNLPDDRQLRRRGRDLFIY